MIVQPIKSIDTETQELITGFKKPVCKTDCVISLHSVKQEQVRERERERERETTTFQTVTGDFPLPFFFIFYNIITSGS